MRVNIKWGLAALVLALALFIALHPWPLDVESATARMNSDFPDGAGLHWRKPKSVVLTLAPWPTLEIDEVDLGNANDRLRLNASVARISLRPLDLALGRFRPMAGELRGANVVLDLDAPSSDNLAATDAPGFPFGAIAAQGPALRVISADRAVDVTVEDFRGWLQWPSSGGPLSFAVEGQWRNETIATEVRIESPARFRKGGSSLAKLWARTPDGELTMEGSFSKRAKGEFTGELTANIASLAKAAKWLGVAKPIVLASDRLSIRASAAGGGNTLNLNDARVSWGAQSLDGSLGLAVANGKLSVSGTLAADSFDVGAALGPPPSLLDAAGQWSGAPLLPTTNPLLELDLRLSISRALWGGAKLENAALALTQRDGKLSVKLLDAAAYRGALAGEVSLERRGDVGIWKGTFSLENADIGALAAGLGNKSYSGTGRVEAHIEGAGSSPLELVATAKGFAAIVQNDVVIRGVNVEEALRRSQRRALDVSRDLLVGETKFAQAEARFEIADGEARIVRGEAAGPGASLTWRGAVGLSAREWKTRFAAAQANASGEPTTGGASLSVDLVGPWQAPRWLPIAGTD